MVVTIGIMVHLDTVVHFRLPQKWRDNVIKNCGDNDEITIDPEKANF